ncbi:MAG: GAF domain-containing protein [Candidatus Krumholzibacteriia bacterium]
MTPASAEQLAGRYERISEQLAGIFAGTEHPVARMATAAAVLHHKLDHFFWTGWYLLHEGQLVVGPYQGPVACPVLAGPEGVCWAGIMGRRTLIVPDVEQFPGHVACDGRSRSEIVVPLRDPDGMVIGVLDVDSQQPDAFGPEDQVGLERIVEMIFRAFEAAPAHDEDASGPVEPA